MNFAGNTNGLYAPLFANGSPLTGNGSGPSAANTLPYAGPPIDRHAPRTAAPQIVIENLPSVAVAGDDLSVTSLNPASPPVTVYRVTAQGVGASNTSTTMLQTIVR